MKPLYRSTAAALALVVSTSAMGLQPSRTDTRARPAGTVINTILNRDSGVDRRQETSKEQAKRDRERAKQLRKQEHERRKAMREREKDARERKHDRRN